tara:strand:+ start:154 stop:531 length:378 start_codon:yes stop_codon:yes gene_type:complete
MEFITKNIHWLLRLSIGSTFIIHGWPKLGSNMDMGLIGWLVGPFEFIGALFILLGPFTTFKLTLESSKAYSISLLTSLGAAMISVIMIGAIYMHLFKWGDGLADIEWQILLLAVSLYFVVKGDKI